MRVIATSWAAKSLYACMLLVLLCVFAGSFTWAASGSSDFRSADVLEEVVVVGKQPGPKLWRVRHGENELWVLGVLSPLPRDMEWDTASVEAVMEDAEEFIEPPGVGVSANPFKLLLVMPSLIGVEKLPDGKRLSDVLPVGLYQRWSALKSEYLGRNKGIERKRPMIAVNELYAEALDTNGLRKSDSIFAKVRKLAKRYDVPITSTSLSRKVKNPRKTVREFKHASIDDQTCFRATLKRIELDLPVMRERALAWAAGDMDALAALPYEDQARSCADALLSSSFAADLGKELSLEDVETQLRERWLTAARTALKRNRVTFAVLPIGELLQREGLVTALGADGFTVSGG